MGIPFGESERLRVVTATQIFVDQHESQAVMVVPVELHEPLRRGYRTVALLSGEPPLKRAHQASQRGSVLGDDPRHCGLRVVRTGVGNDGFITGKHWSQQQVVEPRRLCLGVARYRGREVIENIETVETLRVRAQESAPAALSIDVPDLVSVKRLVLHRERLLQG